MSLARRHRDKVLATISVLADPASAAAGGAEATLAAVTDIPAAGAATAATAAAPSATPADRAAAVIGQRLRHDLQRLKEIKSVDAKVAAKREMLPQYRDWCLGILEADAGVGTGLASEVLPTMMVWLIDVGNHDEALQILPFLLRHKVPMPSRYQRDAATIAIEEIAEAALKAQATGESFQLEMLPLVDQLTAGLDVHDEVRAKLAKAIGVNGLDIAEELPADQAVEALRHVRQSLLEAMRLNPRIGVKDKLKRTEKLLSALSKQAAPPANETTDQGNTA